MAFLYQFTPFDGVSTTVTQAETRDPRHSRRAIHYAADWNDNATYALPEIPIYHDLATDCPSCSQDLHYSSGWGIRTCLLCGFIEGVGGYHVYPRAVCIQEWLFIVGQLFEQVLQGSLPIQEFRDELRQITFVGSAYRPWGEEML